MMRWVASLCAMFWMASPLFSGPVVFAASSLKPALDPIALAYERDTGERVVISYAATSQLVRQIDVGAPADVFLSAHPQWTARLEQPSIVFARNQLVIAGHVDWPMPQVNKRFAIPLVGAVPLGIYGKQALTALGLWNGLSHVAIQTQNAALARALVLRGDVAWGVLYASDVLGEDIPIVQLDASLHDPVTYDAVVLTPEGQTFADWLLSQDAQIILQNTGFGRVD